MLVLSVPDEVVIGFFTAVVAGMSTAIVMLWRRIVALEDRDRDDDPDSA